MLSGDTSRRGFLAAAATIAAATAVSTLPSAMAAGAAFGPGPRSGLPWHSGCSLNKWDAFVAYRRRPIDTITVWCPHETWGQVVSLTGGFPKALASGARVSVAIAPLPKTHRGQLAQAASGAFDVYYTAWARKLAASGITNAIVRVGWECNGGSRPWYAGRDPDAFKDMFQRIASIVRQYNPTVSIEWNNIKKGGQKVSVLTQYPGDDHVDIIGVNYYDGWPGLNTEEIWNQRYNVTYRGGPWGIGAWLSFAKSRGKLLSCSEWGINVGTEVNSSPDAKDNPVYIEKMYGFFLANSAHIAYENYFNQRIYHQLTPVARFPLASQKYQELWSA